MTNDGSPGNPAQPLESEGDGPGDPRLELEFHSEHLAEPFRDQFEQPVTIDVYAIVHLDDGTHLQFWQVTHSDIETVLQTVTEFPTTLDARLLSSVEDTHRIEVLGSTDSLFSAFDEFDGITRSAIYNDSGVHVVAEFPADIYPGVVDDAVQDIYPDLELVSTRTVETTSAFRRLVEQRLTDRQLTVLRLAYFSGYYAQPRQRTGEQLAARLGISKQAFYEHLRKAHAVVFEELLETEFDDEVYL